MPATYEPITTQTLTGTTTSLSISSIPSTYTDLVLVVAGTVNITTGFEIRFNGDTATNYSRTRLQGDGSSVASVRSTNINYIGAGNIGTDQSVSIFHIMNYSNTTTYKTIIARGNNAGGFVNANVGLWRSTSAITSITLGGGTFQIGTTFTLYGIKASA